MNPIFKQLSDELLDNLKEKTPNLLMQTVGVQQGTFATYNRSKNAVKFTISCIIAKAIREKYQNLSWEHDGDGLITGFILK